MASGKPQVTEGTIAWMPAPHQGATWLPGELDTVRQLQVTLVHELADIPAASSPVEAQRVSGSSPPAPVPPPPSSGEMLPDYGSVTAEAKLVVQEHIQLDVGERAVEAHIDCCASETAHVCIAWELEYNTTPSTTSCAAVVTKRLTLSICVATCLGEAMLPCGRKCSTSC